MQELGLHEESLNAPLGIPALNSYGWNIRVLDREDLREFSQGNGITILYTPLARGQTHLCLSLSSQARVLLVDSNMSEPEILYYAWFGWAGLLGESGIAAHKLALCAAIPKAFLNYERLKKQRVSPALIGARFWLAERYGF